MPEIIKAPARRGSPGKNRERAADEAQQRRQSAGAAYQRPPSDGDQVWVRLDEIVPNPENDRTDPGDLTDIAGSIREVGLIEPLLLLPRTMYVNRTDDGRDNRESRLVETWLDLHPELDRTDTSVLERARGVPWVLLAGWRRYCAARQVEHEAEWTRVEGIIRGEMVSRMYQVMLWENMHRKALNPLEEGRAYQRLMDEAGALGTPMGVNEFARRFHLSKAKVSKRLRLLKAPEAFQAYTAQGVFTAEGAYKLQVAELESRADEVVALLVQDLSIEAAIERLAGRSGTTPPASAPSDSAPRPADAGIPDEEERGDEEPPAAAPIPSQRPEAAAAAAAGPAREPWAPPVPDPTIGAAERRRYACQAVIQANSAPSGVITELLAMALLAHVVPSVDEKTEPWVWAGEWLETDPAKPTHNRARTKHAFALTLAVIEERIATEGTISDMLAVAYLDLLRRRGGYQPTPSESRLIAVWQAEQVAR